MSDQLALSRFVELGRQTFADGDGNSVVPVYVASTPELVMVPQIVAEELVAGRAATLPIEHRELLEALGILASDEVITQRLRDARAEVHADPGVRTFTLLPSSFCNMACSYCGQAHEAGKLQARHRDAIRARVLHAIESGRWDRVHVQWFGGEPMTAYPAVLDLAQSFTCAARESGTAYTSQMTTNGSLLREAKVAALVEASVGRFDITIDGPAQIHDISRPLKNGKGNFDRLIDLLARVIPQYADRDTTFVLRTNVSRANLEAVPEYLETIAGRIGPWPHLHFDITPIHMWGKDIDDQAAQTAELDASELQTFRLMHEHGFQPNLLPYKLVLRTCVAVDPHAEVVDRDGNLYSCVEHPLVPKDRLANRIGLLDELHVAQPRPADIYSEWAAETEARGLPCRRCSLNPVCGGGCPKAWVDEGAGCPSIRRTIRDRLDLAAEFAGYSPRGLLRAA